MISISDKKDIKETMLKKAIQSSFSIPTIAEEENLKKAISKTIDEVEKCQIQI